MAKRQITNRLFDAREWQKEAYRATLEKYNNGGKSFLTVATPGAGKTKYAITVAHYFLINKLCERIVIVTPSDELKKQWAQTAAEFAGIDIDPNFSNNFGIEANDYYGIAITYALLAQDKKFIHQQNTFNHKTLVIFDEPHHMGDSLSWGEAALKAFDGAVFRLLISGTPFRSDDAKIPFVTYNNNVSVSDYEYSYERAIKENVCRPVYFSIFDGIMKWKVGAEEFEHTFKDSLQPDQVSKRLKTALDPSGNWVRDVLRAADSKLIEIRGTHRDAAAMVVASTQKHAKELAKVIEEITGKLPPIVVSEDGDGSEKIERFRRGYDRWLVSVRMVSEGVDIPRLRVGVYFTIIKAELFFRQLTGRFVRVLAHLQAQDAFIFIPQDKDIVRLAESIQEERDHALDEAERAALGQNDPDTLFGSDYQNALTGKFQPLGSDATDNKIISVNVEINNGAKHGIDHRKPEEQEPVYQQKKHLRERLNLLAKQYAIKTTNGNRSIRPDFKIAHKKWMEAGGKNMELETIDELNRRVIFYQNLIRN